MEHDILGAARAGVHSLFIASGVHKSVCINSNALEARNTPEASHINENGVQRLYMEHSCTPTWVMSHLAW
jgi:ribonucleotide monophosphatase NagD (HAD superfamily)